MMAIAEMIYIYATGLIAACAAGIFFMLYTARNLKKIKELIDEKEIAARTLFATQEGQCHALTSYGERCPYPSEPHSHYCIIHREMDKDTHGRS